MTTSTADEPHPSIVRLVHVGTEQPTQKRHMTRFQNVSATTQQAPGPGNPAVGAGQTIDVDDPSATILRRQPALWQELATIIPDSSEEV